MYEPDQDMWIIRSESVFYYCFTILVLLFCGLYAFAWFYFLFGIAAAYNDEDEEDEMEDETLEYEWVLISDCTISEILGYEFDIEDLESYIDMATEDIVFANTSKTVILYKKWLDTKVPFSPVKSMRLWEGFLKKKALKAFRQSYRSKFSFLTYKSAYDTARFKQSLRYSAKMNPAQYDDIMMFYKVQEVHTEFVLNTFVACGLYSSTQYDFDVFKRSLIKKKSRKFKKPMRYFKFS